MFSNLYNHNKTHFVFQERDDTGAAGPAGAGQGALQEARQAQVSIRRAPGNGQGQEEQFIFYFFFNSSIEREGKLAVKTKIN